MQQYLDEWNFLVAESYSAPLPDALRAACGEKGNVGALVERSLPGATTTSAAAQSVCDAISLCVIPFGATLRMDGPLNVGALLVRGTLVWDDATQAGAAEQWLCAGYVAVEAAGTMMVSLPSSSHSAFLYLKNNGAVHGGGLGRRALGAVGGGRLELRGRALGRAWSLLAEAPAAGASQLALIHDPEQMGWRVGDRIVVAPTGREAREDAHPTTVTGFAPGNVVLLGAPLPRALSWEFRAHEGTLALLTAEVINLSRNVLVTGDDFTHEACGSGAVDSTKICTYGLHTAARDAGSVMVAEHVRLERCGQRGVSGKH